MKHTDKHLRLVEVLIHVTGWGILFGFPFVMMNRSGVNITWPDYLRHGCIVPLSFLVVFYANYCWLIPRLLFAGRTRQYILYNVLLIATALAGAQFWQEWTMQLEPHARPAWVRPGGSSGRATPSPWC